MSSLEKAAIEVAIIPGAAARIEERLGPDLYERAWRKRRQEVK
jgi:hypothetical protein